MTSYHRILKLFGRSVQDRALQCDCDLQPWQISVDGEQWNGKTRLIGFIDTVFLIAYTQKSTFRSGIVIYKNGEDVEKVLKKAKLPFGQFQHERKLDLQDLEAYYADEDGAGLAASKPPEIGKYLNFSRDMMEYKISGVGHQIDLKTKYISTDIRRWKIAVRKPDDPIQKAQIKKAFKEHDTLDILQDAIDVGIVTYAEVLGRGANVVADSAFTKSFTGAMSGSRSEKRGMLSGGHL